MQDKYLLRVFLERTDKNGPTLSEELGQCWIWTGNLDKDGYGDFMDRDKRHHRAHRLSYLLFKVNYNSKLFVLHKCDNPSCVNPEHLFQGTPKDNYDDAVSKGRIKTENWSRPAPRKVFPEHEARIIELCKQGINHSVIAKEIGVVREIVSKYARKHGFRKNFNSEEIEQMKQMHNSGMNYRQIAETFGREQSSIRKAIARS